MLKDKIIEKLNTIDDQELLLFILIIIEDALQWQQLSGIGV